MGNYITQISEINTDNIFNNCINLISCDNNNNNNKLDTLQTNTIQPDVYSTQPLLNIDTSNNAPIETPIHNNIKY